MDERRSTKRPALGTEPVGLITDATSASDDGWAARFLRMPVALPFILSVAVSIALLRSWGPSWIVTYYYTAAWNYFRPGLTLSYTDFGLTRRALIGTVTTALGIEPTVSAVKIIYVLGVALATVGLFATAWTKSRSLAPRERLLMLVLLGLSPATLLHWGDDAGRTDAWVVLFGVLAALLAGRGLHLLAVAPAIAAGLIHESYFLLFGPLFIAIGYERFRRDIITRAEWLRGSAALSILGAAFLYLFFFGTADTDALHRAAQKIGVTITRTGENPYYSYLGFEANPLGWTMCFFREEPLLILSTIVAFAYLIVHGVALLGWSGRIRQGIMLLTLPGSVALTMIALDSSRYISLAAIAIWLQFFFALETERPVSVFRTWSLGALCAFTLLGPLGISHGFHSILWILRLSGGRIFQELAPVCNAII